MRISDWSSDVCSSDLFYYVGPVDGHNLDHLIPVLENVRDAAEGPCLIHVVTQKGKGYAPAEAEEDKYHGVQKFDVVSGEQRREARRGGKELVSQGRTRWSPYH